MSNSEFFQMFNKKQLEANNSWLLKAYTKTKEQHKNENLEKNPTEKRGYFDENFAFSFPSFNKKDGNDKYYDINGIQEFLGETEVKNESDPLSNSIDIGEFIEQNKKEFRPLNNIDGIGVLKVSLESLDIPKLDIEFLGFVQLYSYKKYVPLSDRAYFSNSDDGVIFNQSNNKSFFFQINKRNDVSILCVLCKKIAATTIPFAISYVPLFDDNLQFLSPSRFHSGFYEVDGSLIDSIIKIFCSKNQRLVQKIGVRMSTELVDDPGDLNYAWNPCEGENRLATPSTFSMFATPPVITINNFRLYFKNPPKCRTIALKAFLLTEPDSVPRPVMIVPYSQNLECLYVTLSQPVKNDISFHENIRIICEGPPQPDEHLVIQISGDEAPVAIAVMMIPRESGEVQAKVFEQTDLPANYLTKAKSKKILLTVDAKVPTNILVPQEILDINVDKVMWQQFSNEVLSDNLIPLICKFFDNLNCESGMKLVELVQFVNKKNFLAAVKPWVDNIFNPKDAFPSFFEDVTTVFSAITMAFIDSEDVPMIEALATLLPFLIDSLNVCLLTQREACDDLETFVAFINQSTLILGRMIKLGKESEEKMAIKNSLNESLANIMRTLLVHYNFKDFQMLFLTHVHKLMELQSSFLLLKFYILLIQTPTFVKKITEKVDISFVEKGDSPFNKYISPLFYELSKEVDRNENNEAMMSLSVRCLSLIALQGEQMDGEERVRVAATLLPILPTVFAIFVMPIMKKSPETCKKIIPTIAFLLAYSPVNGLRAFYVSLGSMQASFITFLAQAAKIEIMQVTARSPTKMQPCLEQRFLCELTRRILTFIINIKDYLVHLDDEASNLVYELLCDYQPLDNIPLMFKVCSLLVENQNEDVRRAINKWAFALVSKSAEKIRNMGAAIIIRSLQIDYKETNTVFISSVAIMDCLTEYMFSCNAKLIPICMELLDTIIEFLKQTDGEFKDAACERIEASIVVAKCVIKQRDTTAPPEVNCRNLMRIADQYMQIPSMRLKWLKQIVAINASVEDYPSSFISQMHIVALTANVLSEKLGDSINNNADNDDEIPLHIQITQPLHRAIQRIKSGKIFHPEDFSFIPSLASETKQFSSKLPPSLLSDFTIEGLVNEIEYAVSLARQAGLYYSLRAVHSLQVIINCLNRDFKGISQTFSALSSDLTKIACSNNDVISPLSFFLVEWREDSGDVHRFVYCIHGGVSSKFISFLNNEQRFNGMEANMCEYHSEECNKPGVCVVPLMKVNKAHMKGESSHYWSDFICNFHLKEEETVKITKIRTKDCLPHYRMSTDVVEYEVITLNIQELAVEIVKNDIELLNGTTSSLRSWIPSNSSFILQHIEYVPRAVQTVEIEECHSREVLNILNKFNHEAAKELALKLYDPLLNVLTAFSDAICFIQMNEQYSHILDLNVKETQEMFEVFGISFDVPHKLTLERMPMDEVVF